MAEFDARRALDALSDAVLIADGGQRILHATPSACRLLQQEAHRLEGRTLAELIPPPHEPMDVGKPVLVRALRGDGSLIERELTLSRTTDTDADAEILVATLREPPCTDKPDETANKLRAVLETISVGVIVAEGIAGRLTLINPAAYRIAGETAPIESYEDFVRAFPLERLDGKVMTMMDRPLARTFESGKPVHDTLKFRRKDGREVVVAITTAPFPGPAGGAVTTFADVTERFYLDQDLADRAAQLRALLDHLPVGVAYFDKMAVCRVGNGPARRILGRSRREIDGATADELFAQAPELREALQRCVVQNLPHLQQRVPWPDASRPGTVRYLDWQFEPLSTDNAKSRGALALLVDVTDRTLAEVEIQKAMEASEEASRRKTQFLSAVSHDLRTPINALSLQAELLARIVDLRDDPGGELQLLAGDIRAVSSNLIELINDLLDLTQFDSGAVDFHPSEFELDDWLAATAAPLELSARTKGLDFHWRVEPAGQKVKTDRVKLGRLLVNLVGNAVKFTDHGEIAIRAGVNQEGWLVLQVRDTGPGIPPNQLERIFDEFSQLRNPERDRTKGTGLGLAICRRLVENVGGRMTVHSEIGKGSTFTALYPPDHVIPRSNPLIETAEMALLTPKSSLGTSILIVEDDIDSRSALAKLLEHSGHRVQTVGTGLDALESLDQMHIPIVLLDLLLPGMDGIEVLRRIREDPIRNESRVVILTGDAVADQADWLRSLGADEVLPKPIDFASLREVIERLVPIGST